MNALLKNRIISTILITVLLLSVLPTTGAHKVNASEDMYDTARLKWKRTLTGEHYSPDNPHIAKRIEQITKTAQNHWDAMIKTDERSSIWPNLWFNYADIHTNYSRLNAMALAHETYGSALYKNDGMLKNILSALAWLEAENKYSATSSAPGNWWQWQIGVPLSLHDINALLYDYISDEQRAKYMASIAKHNEIKRAAANRVWECSIRAKTGIILKDEALIQQSKDGLSETLGIVNSGNGYYDDGSYIDHNYFPYNGGYGQALIDIITDFMYILEDSPLQISEVAKNNVYRWVYDSYEMFIYKGSFMDMVRGREMARENSTTDQIGHKVMSAILRLSQFAPEKDSKAFKSMVKYWINSNDKKDYFADASIDMITFAQSVLDDPTIQPKDELIKYKQFYRMDRAVQLRPGYGVGLSMFSNRISNYESINSENQKAYHTASGMMYLYNNDVLQYSDDFWPTVNMYRMPGTTVLKDSTVPGNKPISDALAGGVELEGLYGVSGMDMRVTGQSLSAKKSWFLFDNEIVSLGSGIGSSDGVTVETIVENRKINGNNDFVVNGAKKANSADWNENIQQAKWAHLEGNVEGADIGYYFPDESNINALRESRTGSWKNVATGNSATPITSSYLAMWYDHGINPVDGSYAYVTLPNQSANQTEQYSKNPDIAIIKNSPDVQAVKDTNLNITGANFWTDTKQTAGNITSNKKSSVMAKETDNELIVTVSDPTQTNTDWIDIEIAKSAAAVISTDHSIVVKQLYPTIKFAVSVNNAKGRPHEVRFSLTGSIPRPSGKDTYIVDNTDPGFTTDPTPWANSYVTGYYGVNSLTDNTAGADTDRWAKWTPAIIESDTYDVYMRWNSGTNRPNNVPIEVSYDNGIDTDKIANQRYNNGVWVYIGSYPMSAGINNYVKLHASGAGYTSADAVKFVAQHAEGNMTFPPVEVKNDVPRGINTIAYEDFDHGEFTTEDILSGSNIHKKLLIKNNNTVMTAELNSTNVSFETANPAYNSTLLKQDEGAPSKKINTTQYYSTDPGKLTRASGGEDIRIYYNLPTKITDTKSPIFVDVRLKKSLTESITMNICQDQMTSYSQAGSRRAVSFTVNKYTPSLIYNLSSKVNSTKNFDFGEWIYVRSVIDLTSKTVAMYCGETLDNLQPWTGLGDNNTYQLIDTNANGVSSIYFNGKGTLSIDDLHIYTLKPVLDNIEIRDNILKSIDIINTATLPDNIMIAAAVYNEDSSLVKVEQIKNVTVDKNRNEQTLHFQNDIKCTQGQIVKIFAWDLNKLNALTHTYVYPRNELEIVN